VRESFSSRLSAGLKTQSAQPPARRERKYVSFLLIEDSRYAEEGRKEKIYSGIAVKIIIVNIRTCF